MSTRPVKTILLSLLFFATACGSSQTSSKTDAASSGDTSSPAQNQSSTASASSSSGAPAAGKATSGAATTKATPSKDWSDETFGGIGAGTPESEVIAILGKPRSRTEATEEGASGDWVVGVQYPGTGWGFDYRADKAAGPYFVRTLTIEAPVTAKSTRNIGLGSTRAEVEAAYGAWKNPDMSLPPKMLHFGDWGGIKFTFDAHDRVESIAIGVDPE
ncbi:MAG: hypothetical protein U0271_06335 [Polyangiaceae bacterium]